MRLARASSPRGWPHWLAILLLSGAALLLVGSIVHVALNVRQTGYTEDFGYFYGAAKAMLAGGDIYAETGGRYIYPPFLAFVLQPLALLPETVAAVFWAGLNACFFAAALLITSAEASARWNQSERNAAIVFAPGAIALLLFGEKIHANFTLGQTDALMLLGFACVLRWMQSRPLLTGLIIGATANVKYLTLIFVPYFLLKRNYRAALSSCAAFAIFMLLPTVQIGLTQSAQFITGALSGLVKMMGFASSSQAGANVFDVEWQRSISITSAMFRFARAHAMPDTTAVVLTGLVFVAFSAAVWLIARKFRVPMFTRDSLDDAPSRAITSLEWSVLIFVAVAFSPQATARHMTLLVLASVVALSILRRKDGAAATGALVLSMTLTLVGLSFPWRALGLRHASDTWRNIGGVTWCAALMILALVWRGLSDATRSLRGHANAHQ